MKPSLEHALTEAHQVSRRRQAIRAKLREALKRDDEKSALDYARQLVGMDDEAESDRDRSGFERGAGGAG